MKRGFGSDNHSGISPEIMKAIADANTDHALAYGDDEWCARTEALFRDCFGPQAKVYFVFNGTGANVLSIDAMCRSHEAVVCAETAHINVDECGAPQRVVGCRLLTVDTPDGKLTPEPRAPNSVPSIPSAKSVPSPTWPTHIICFSTWMAPVWPMPLCP